MANVTITKQTLPHNTSGLNITDATYTTIHDGDAAVWTWANSDLVVFKALVGEILTAELTLGPFPAITQYGGTVTSPQVTELNDTEPNDRIVLVRMDSQFVQADGSAKAANNSGVDFAIAVFTM